MSRLVLILASCGGIVMCCGPAAQAEPKVVASVTLSSAERVLQRIERLGEVSGRPELRQLLQQQLGAMAELSGIDRQQPASLLVVSDGAAPTLPEAVVALPVADVEKLLATLDNIPRVDVSPQDAGGWRIQTPRRTFFAQLRENRLLIATRESLLSAPGLVESASDTGGLGDSQDFRLRINVANLPALIKDLALAKMDLDIDQQLARKPSEDAAEHEARVALILLAADLIRQFVTDTDEFHAGAQLEETMNIELVWTARAGSPLAREFGLLSLPEATRAEIPGAGSAFRADVAVRVPDRIRRGLEEVLTQVRAKLGREVGSRLAAEDRQPAGGVFDAVSATIADGRWMTSVEFQPQPDGAMLLFSSVEIDRADRLAESLRTVLPYAARSDEVRSVQENVIATDAMTVHRLQARHVRARDRKLYGEDAAVWFGTTPSSFLVAVSGGDASASLRESARIPVTAPPLAELHWRFRPWVELASPLQPVPGVRERLERAFRSTENDGLQVVLTAEGREVHARIQLESGVLRLLGEWLPHRRGGVQERDE